MARGFPVTRGTDQALGKVRVMAPSPEPHHSVYPGFFPNLKQGRAIRSWTGGDSEAGVQKVVLEDLP